MALKVVIIEDNPATVRSLVQTIDWAALGCSVAGTAADGESGRNLLLRLKPDIVLTDIHMPQKDGLEMIEEVRQALPECKMIIITGYDQFQYASRAIKLAAFDYILKPIHNEDLTRTLRRAAALIHRQREASLELAQAGVLRRRAQLTALITNGSQQTQEAEQLLRDVGLDGNAYYLMALQFSQERPFPQAMLNHLDAVFAKCGVNAVTLFLYDTVVAFVMREDQGEGWREEAERMIAELSAELVSPVHIGVSALGASPHATRDAYRQACQALWDIVLRKDPPGSNFYLEGAPPHASERITELRLRIDELVKEAELSDESAANAARVLAEQSLPVRSNLRSMVMLYALELRKKFPFPLDAECNQALNDIWFVSCEADVRSCLTRLCAGLRAARERKESTRQSLLTRNALQYVRLHAIEGLRLEDVAQTLRVSASYLSALIRKETGVTFHQHVLEAKMAVARTMLADPRVLVEEVAHAVGYGSYISFYNAFKRLEHMTPTEYRNQKVEL